MGNRAVGEFHDVERVRDLAGLWQRRVERGAVGAREVQCRPTDLRAPLLGPFRQPTHRRLSGAATDYVEQLAAPDVDDVGGPGLGPIPAAARELGSRRAPAPAPRRPDRHQRRAALDPSAAATC